MSRAHTSGVAGLHSSRVSRDGHWEAVRATDVPGLSTFQKGKRRLWMTPPTEALKVAHQTGKQL